MSVLTYRQWAPLAQLRGEVNRLQPVMDTVRRPTKTVRVEQPSYWHFRAMPSEIQRGAIRRLALSGLAESDIAARIGWPVDSVRQTILEDECVRHLMLQTSHHSRRRPSGTGQSFAG